MNGDQKPDLAVANSSGGKVSVLLNHGDGTFAVKVGKYIASGEAKPPAMADLNGDGKPDLAVTNGGAVGVLLNLGDGTFATKVDYPVPAERGRRRAT